VTRFLLDTNAVIELLRNRNIRLARRARREPPGGIALSAIVAHELFYGAFKSRRAVDNVAQVEALRFQVLAFDKEDARRAGQIRAHLAATGGEIGLYDVLIAGQAAARDLILITHNVREFARVPGLRIEDWEE
jgi:tRNA(fMet)-specific endonuclease VapC